MRRYVTRVKYYILTTGGKTLQQTKPLRNMKMKKHERLHLHPNCSSSSNKSLYAGISTCVFFFFGYISLYIYIYKKNTKNKNLWFSAAIKDLCKSVALLIKGLSELLLEDTTRHVTRIQNDGITAQ